MEHPEGDRVCRGGGGVKVRTQEGKGRDLRAHEQLPGLEEPVVYKADLCLNLGVEAGG